MASMAADGATLRFSTDDLPERDRIAAWREQFGRTVLGVDFEPLPDVPVHADITLRALPGLSIGSGSISAASHRRTRELMPDGNDDVYLVVANETACTVSQRGRQIALNDGDAVLIHGAAASTFISSTTLHFLNLRIGSAVLAPLVANLDDAITRPILRSTNALRLLVDYVPLLRQHRALATPALRHLAITHVHDLVALAIGATRDAAAIAEGRSVRAARLHAVKTEIVGNLGRRDLSVATVAARHGVTPRYVQRLFEAEGTTFSEFLLGQRLARAHRLLVDPRCAGQAINTIAFDVGFGDLSYFNRTFRRRYGASPSDVREAAQRLGGQ